MDRSVRSSGHLDPGVSLRMGPVEMELDEGPRINGANGKRKARTNGATYKGASGSEDEDLPLVSFMPNHPATC